MFLRTVSRENNVPLNECRDIASLDGVSGMFPLEGIPSKNYSYKNMKLLCAASVLLH